MHIDGYAPNVNAIADIVQTIKALEDVTAIESQIGDISKLAEV